MKVCEAGRDSCGCKEFTKGIRTINGQYPDDNRDFDINAGSGIRIDPATGGITISNDAAAQSFVAGDNIEINPSGDDLEISVTDDISITGDLSVGDEATITGDLSVGGAAAITGDASVAGDTTLNGDLNVNGNIYNQGASYESHMEQVYTNDDYIIMRDGAVTGLGSGDFSGFQVKLYDGVNDGRLVIDSSGTARVGDVGDEQPLLTREESADLTDGDVLTWDSLTSKAVGVPIDASPANGSSNPISSDAVYQTCIKATVTDITPNTIPGNTGTITLTEIGNLAIITAVNVSTSSLNIYDIPAAPVPLSQVFGTCCDTNASSITGMIYTLANNKVRIRIQSNLGCYGSITYVKA